MSWDVTIRHADGSPLGERESVKRAISAVFAGVQFYREPSGPEKIAAARAAGIEFPDILRQHFEQQSATEQADFESDGFSARFFLEAEPELLSVAVEIRGDTERAMPFLRRLSSQSGWGVAAG